MGPRPSFAWRSILHGRELLEKGLRQGIGNGASVKVWTTRWIQDDILRAPFMKNILVNLELTVADLLDPITKSWDRDKLQDHFFQRDQDLIIKIKPAPSSPDFMVWLHNRSGDYSVRSGYWLASQNHDVELQHEVASLPSLNPIKEKIWEVLAPSKIKMFLWKAVSGAIPVAERLATRGVRIDPRCLICGFEGESINHVLFLCSSARQTWALSNIPSPENGFSDHSLYHNVFHVLLMSKNSDLPIDSRRIVPWILWILWKNRNNMVFEGKIFHQLDMIAKIKEDAGNWFLAQQVEKEEETITGKALAGTHKFWKPPDNPWLKCNIASSWDKHNKVGGAA